MWFEQLNFIGGSQNNKAAFQWEFEVCFFSHPNLHAYNIHLVGSIQGLGWYADWAGQWRVGTAQQ